MLKGSRACEETGTISTVEPIEPIAFHTDPWVWRYVFLLDSSLFSLCIWSSPGFIQDLLKDFVFSTLSCVCVLIWHLVWFWGQTVLAENGWEIFGPLLWEHGLFHWKGDIFQQLVHSFGIGAILSKLAEKPSAISFQTKPFPWNWLVLDLQAFIVANYLRCLNSFKFEMQVAWKLFFYSEETPVRNGIPSYQNFWSCFPSHTRSLINFLFKNSNSASCTFLTIWTHLT